MKNISFDNPYLFLVAIPLALAVLIPFLIAIRKDNRNGHVIASFILHFVIIVAIVFALAGTVVTTVITETNVYIVADVSYSANRNLDTVDKYIDSLVKENLPLNSKVGLICFGADYELVTEMGGELESVKNAQVDSGATHIAPALDYAAGLFEDNVIKRIVLITDGKQTNSEDTKELIASIENLRAQNIYIDAIYLDNNLKEDDFEVQITGVDYTQSTYLNHETTANVLLQSTYDAQTILSVYRNSVNVSSMAVQLSKGYNVVNVELETGDEGDFDYEIRISSENDVSPHNNSYSFTQNVSGDISVLLVTPLASDLDAIHRIYGSKAKIDAFISDPKVKLPEGKYDENSILKKLPVTVEALCEYDEIIISNQDVRELDNYTAFIGNVDKVVSLFGKSLVTVGDLKIQNKTDEVLKQLEDMLPVKFGNSDQKEKLYAIVLDSSLSMDQAYRLITLKKAAVEFLGTLNNDDYVSVISFSGDVKVVYKPVRVGDYRQEIESRINAIKPTQGTFLGSALFQAAELLKDQPFDSREVYLISDGRAFGEETPNAIDVVKDMYAEGINTSAIYPCPPADKTDAGLSMMKSIAKYGSGKFYEIKEDGNLTDMNTMAGLKGGEAAYLELYKGKILKLYISTYDEMPDEIELKITYIGDGQVDSAGNPTNPTKNYLAYGENKITVSKEDIAKGGIEYWFVSPAVGTYVLSTDDENAWVQYEISADMTDQLKETVIEEKSPVNISKEHDDVLEGIKRLPDLYGYVYSSAKASATTVLTTEYTRTGEGVAKPPIYVYWSYGNGKVSTFTSSISGEWARDWVDSTGQDFLHNVLEVNTPPEKIDDPYSVSVEYDGESSSIEVIPAVLNPYATMHMEITLPNGETVADQLLFNSTGYYYEFATPDLGKYKITFTYSYDEYEYVSDTYFNVSYSPEYDSFAAFSASDLNEAVRGNGTITENGVPRIENDEKEISTYKVNYTVPLLIIAVALYVIDIIIRKLKWADIKSLFVKTKTS